MGRRLLAYTAPSWSTLARLEAANAPFGQLTRTIFAGVDCW